MNRPLLTTLLLSSSLGGFAHAQPPPEPPPPAVILIRPAAAPVPALKFRLFPERRNLIPGNAAVFYHRAIEMNLHATRRPQPQPVNGVVPPNPEELAARWLTGPIKDIPLVEAKKYLESFSSPFHEIELGASRQFCDWEFEHRLEGINLVLTEIQEMRGLARLVALRSRIALLEGKTDEAVHWISISYIMARHVSQGPTLIQALVGCSISNMTSVTLEEVIQLPNAPNLYWALAARPRPLIDLGPPIEGEKYMIEREFPSLVDVETAIWSLSKAKKFADELQQKLGMLVESPFFITSPPDPSPKTAVPRLSELFPKLTLSAMVAKAYPEAKRSLITGGFSATEVEAMPAIQVVTIATVRSYNQIQDDVYKWEFVPYWLSYKGFDDAMANCDMTTHNPNPLFALLSMLIPAVKSVRLASVRVDRQLDVLQCVEAIRLYAHSHDGHFPPSLEAITEAPVPLDLAIGKPFEFKADGDVATLAAPIPPGAPNHHAFMIRYQLKLAR